METDSARHEPLNLIYHRVLRVRSASMATHVSTIPIIKPQELPSIHASLGNRTGIRTGNTHTTIRSSASVSHSNQYRFTYPSTNPTMSDFILASQHDKETQVLITYIKFPASPQSLDDSHDTPMIPTISPFIRKRGYSSFSCGYMPAILGLYEPVKSENVPKESTTNFPRSIILSDTAAFMAVIQVLLADPYFRAFKRAPQHMHA
jgi:hypothetical protein